MKAFKIKEDVYWVGAIDWNLRDFHGYATFRGSTYNSYLIIDEKITLFDTVRKGFEKELLTRIKSVIDPEKINYLVINHIEPDHSGGFKTIFEAIKPEKIFITRNGRLGLIEYFHKDDFPFEEVKTGTEVKIGKRTIKFIETPMIHWPDSMISYIPEEKILISQDAFGAHIATGFKFDDEVDYCSLIQETAKYYANIVLPYSSQVQKLLKTLKDLGLEIDMICPDHGVIWRKYVKQVIDLYDKWSSYTADQRVIIVYDTMWHSTEKMAYAILDGVLKEEIEVKLFKISVSDFAEVLTEIMLAKGLILGSPTFYNQVLASMAGFGSYLKSLRPKGKIGAAFGSYGWSGESVKILNEVLKAIQADIIHEGIKVKYAPDKESLSKCEELGKMVARKIKEG